MKRSISVLLILALVFAGVFALLACDAEEVSTEQGGDTAYADTGINVVYWEDNAVNVGMDEVVGLFESVPEREGYYFGGWYFDVNVWQEPADYNDVAGAEDGTILYARWLDEDEVVKVTFYDWSDSLVLYSAYVPVGSDLNGYMTASDKPADGQYEYYFAGWDTPLSNITEDIEVRPVYEQKVRTFTVTFNVDGVTIKTESVEYGKAATAPADKEIEDALPELKGTVCKFAGWDKDFSNITSDLKVNASIAREYATYTVTFVYGDGKSETQTVRYGEDATAPTNDDGKLDKSPSENIDYMFVGWDNNYCFVTEDRVVNAIYNNNVRYFTVDFYDGETLYCRRYVPAGGSAELPSSDPVRLSDETFDYTFAGWDKTAENVTADTVINAVWDSSPRRYTVSFYADGVLIVEKQVDYGGSVTAPTVLEIGEMYYLDGWDSSLENITSDKKVNAVLKLKEFDVTFRYGVEGNYKTYTVSTRYGHAAKAPSGINAEFSSYDTAQYHYVFTGWDVDFSSVTSAMTVTATYDRITRVYAVDFVDDEGNRLTETQYIAYGESAVAPEGDKVAKASTAQYDFAFVGWDGDGWQNVTSAQTVKARYEETLRYYDVVFVAKTESGEDTEYKETLAYGAIITVPETVGSYSDEKYDYAFDGWDIEEGATVTGAYSETASYTATLRKFTVTFVYGNGLEDVQTVEYGNAAKEPTENLEKSATATTRYIFQGWDSANWLNVTKDTTVNAVYVTVENYHEVRFVAEDGVTLLCEVQYVRYGKDTVEQPSEEGLVKASDAQYDYAFSGWTYESADGSEVFVETGDELFGNIDKDYTFKVSYTASVRSYAYTFRDDDGVVLASGTAGYGTALSEIAPETPTKEATAQYTYAFSHWADADGATVSLGTTVGAAVSLTAVYTATVNSYTVKFVYGDGLEDVQTVEYGKAAKEPTENLEKSATATTEYIFQGWENANWLNVTGNMTVNAVYLEVEAYHTVSFYAEDGTTLLSAPQYVRYGKDTLVLPDTTQIVKQQTVSHTFAFTGWDYTDKEGAEQFISHEDLTSMVNAVDADYTFKAHFEATIRQYTVVFMDDNGTTLKEIKADYGKKIAEIEPETPTKEPTKQYVFTFAGWVNAENQTVDTQQTTVGGDVYLKATYDSELRPYTVTFVLGNGAEIQQTVLYGYDADTSDITAEQLVKESTAKYDFAFSGWDKPMTIYEDTVISALYTKTVRNYTITYYDLNDGSYQGSNTLPYGSLIDRTMTEVGYEWDSWYLSNGNGGYTALALPEEITELDEDGISVGHVQGEMVLYGNLVMEGFDYDSSNKIIKYTGVSDFIILPTYDNRAKVPGIGKRIFEERESSKTEEERTGVTVYVPNGLHIDEYAFRVNDKNLDLIWNSDTFSKNTTVLFECSKPTGGLAASVGNFSMFWSSGLSDDKVFWEVNDAIAIGDYEVILYGGEGAILYKFLNASTAYVNIPTSISYKSATDTETKTYTVTTISDYCYYGMTNIQTVFMPAEVEDMKLGAYLFKELTANIYIAMEEPSLGYKIGKWSRYWNYNTWTSKNSDLTIEWNCDGFITSENVTYLLRSNGEASAIAQDMSAIEGFVVKDTVTYGGKVYTVTELGAQLFMDERWLTSVTIPGTIKKIGDKAFYGTNLKSLTLAEGLETIGDFAFASNNNLTYVYVPSTCTEIGYFAFSGANNAELFMGRASAPTGSGLIGYKLGWNYTTSLDGIDLSGNLASSVITSLINNGTTLPTYWSAKGKVTSTIEGKNGLVPARVDLTFIVKTDGKTHLYKAGKSSVYNELESFSIPSSVTFNDVAYPVSTILNGTFSGYTIDTIFIPSTVTTIESNAFDTAVNIKTDAVEQPSGWSLPEGSTVTTGQSGL